MVSLYLRFFPIHLFRIFLRGTLGGDKVKHTIHSFVIMETVHSVLKRYDLFVSITTKYRLDFHDATIRWIVLMETYSLFEFLFLLRYLFLFVSVFFLFLLTIAKMATILKFLCHHFVYFDVVYNCTKFDVYIICRSGIKEGALGAPQ